jgi:hypothetical protein
LRRVGRDKLDRRRAHRCPLAGKFAINALRANGHVPAVLNGKKAKPSTSGYLTMGGEDEAAHYFEEWGFEWITTPGAVDWLMKFAAHGAPNNVTQH